jgi:hypothetical protein
LIESFATAFARLVSAFVSGVLCARFFEDEGAVGVFGVVNVKSENRSSARDLVERRMKNEVWAQSICKRV